MAKIVDELTAMFDPAITAMGLELWGVEYHANSKNAIVRVTIDHAEGITVEHCAAVSHQITGLLDVNDPIPTRYTLEVSSPGLDRALFKPEHFQRYIGQIAKMQLSPPINGRRRLLGRIDAVTDDVVNMTVDDASWSIPHTHIERACLQPEF